MALPSREQDRRLGDFELLYELKSGGMGSVFVGRKRGTGGFEKLVAIKTILPELSGRAELRTMFLDEAQLLSRLEHPAVAQVYDFGEQDQTLYLAMEYVQGVRFSDLIELAVPPATSARLIAETCRALHAAHELCDLDGQSLDVVHRDVSPDNLMLSFDGHVKVLDFGIALMRGRQAPVTEYGTIKGKPPYLSPEQVRGERIDRQSDIWSVGVVLWEMLTGEHLFMADSLYAVARAVEEGPIPAPSSIAGPLPDGLDEVVLRALSRDRRSRYQLARHMADELTHIANTVAAPSTVDYAAGALSVKQDEHREWLRQVLGGSATSQPVGRPTGMVTVPAVEMGAEDASPLEPQAPPDAHDLAALNAESDATGGARGRETRSRTPLLMALIVGLLLLALIVYLQARAKTAPEGHSTAVLVPIDAGAPLAVIDDSGEADDETALEPAIDAEPLAAQAPDAGRGTSSPRGRRRAAHRTKKESLDAAPTIQAPKPPTVDTKAHGLGTLTVAAEPYALVRIDGVEVGSTPIFKRRIESGPHLIELLHPESGAVRLRRTVTIPADGHKSVIDR